MARLLLRGLIPGADYKLQFRARDEDSVSKWSRRFSLSVIDDNVAPDTPNFTSWVVNGSDFVGDWDEVDTSLEQNKDFDHYELSMTGGSSTRVIRTTDTSYTLTFANNRNFFGSPKATVTAKVRAVDSSGNASAYSSTLSATNPVPDPPTDPVVEEGIDSLDISWTPPADDDLIGYNVYVGTTSGFTPSPSNKIFSGNATRFTYTSTTYTLQYFKIRAVDVFGQESTDLLTSGTPVTPFGVDTTAPATPTGLSATITTSTSPDLNTIATVSWTANGESDLAGYFLRYRKNGDTNWTVIRVDKSSTTTVVTNLVPYVDYDFQLSAVDWSENQSAYTSTATGTGATNSAPSTPAAPSVSTDTLHAQVSISGNKAAGGAMEADVQFYEVYGSSTTGFTPGTTNMLGVVPVGPAMIATFDIPASNSSGTTQTWYFKIIAVDNGGLKSAASAQASGTPGLILSANIGDLQVTNAKISDLTVTKLTAGTGLTTSFTVKSTLTIGDASTTGSIQSFDYSAGTAGYKISSVGGTASLEINQGTIRSAALLIQNGSNIFNSRYADFEANSAFFSSSNFTLTNATVAQNTSNKKFNTASLAYSPTNVTNSVFLGTTNTDYNFVVQPSTDYIVSFYAMVATAGVAANLTATVKYQTASSPGTLSLSAQPIAANSTWARYSGVISVPGTATGGAIVSFSTNTASGTVFIDGIQIEEKQSASTVPSSWKPPGATTIDGYQIKTGSIVSNTTTVVNGSTIPVWSIPLNGAATFANLQVRGNAIIGVPGGTDGGASTLSSGNYIAGTTGWQIQSDGDAEFNGATLRGGAITGTSFSTGDSGNRIEIADSTFSGSGYSFVNFYGDGTENQPSRIYTQANSSYSLVQWDGFYSDSASGTQAIVMESWSPGASPLPHSWSSNITLVSDLIFLGGLISPESQGETPHISKSRTTGQTITTGTVTIQVYNVEDSRGGITDNGAGTYTVMVPGFYIIGASAGWDNSLSTGRRQIAININGTQRAVNAVQASGGPSSNFTSSIQWAGYLADGDTFDIRVFHNQGANAATLGDATLTYMYAGRTM
jgi:hypothetical protein